MRSLSPIVAYSTLLRPDGRKYTCYFQPGEAEFSRLVAQNLERKYFVVHGREPRAGLTLEVLRVGRMVISESSEGHRGEGVALRTGTGGTARPTAAGTRCGAWKQEQPGLGVLTFSAPQRATRW